MYREYTFFYDSLNNFNNCYPIIEEQRTIINQTQILIDLPQNNSLIYLDEQIKKVQEKITSELNTTLIDNGDDFIVSSKKRLTQ